MEPKSIKELFDKYVLIWVWSIFVTINTALSYNLFDTYSTTRWGALFTIMLPIYIIAAALTMGSWFALFNFFRIKILTLILDVDLGYHKSTREKGLDDKSSFEANLEEPSEETIREKRKIDMFAYKQLRVSFFFIVLAFTMRFFISIIQMAINHQF
jgi:ABC-type amino acid transport system permease subunit